VRRYIIVAESGADLSDEMIEKYGVRVAQMHVEIDGVDYLDNTVSMEKLTGFYDTTGKVPKTAGVNPNQYEEIFQSIKNEDPDAAIIHICYSAKLSIGYQSSLLADDGSMEIYHVDSKNVSIGQAFVVMKAAELIEQEPGIEPAELTERLEGIIKKVRFSFLPGNLDYLRAGGRVSNAQYLGAKLLRIKPLIEVLDGFMLTTKKYRGSNKKTINRMMSEFFQKYAIDKQTVFLVYACELDPAMQKEMENAAKQAGIANVVWLRTGSVITSHSGPGGLGVAGIEL
jgi:DegV family protein with EDD domain